MDSEIAKITMLRRFHLTSDSMEPAATTMPNMTITPPPSTSIGIVRMSAPTFGIRPADDQEQGADGHHMAAHHAGHGDQAHILAERGVRQPTKNAGETAVPNTVGIGRAFDLLVGRFAPRPPLVMPGYVADGFDRRDEGHQAEADDGSGRELERRT